MSGLGYIQEYIVRESIINFEVSQRVRLRGEEKEWRVAAIQGRRIKVYSGTEERTYNAGELETLDVPTIQHEYSRTNWTRLQVEKLKENLHKAPSVVSAILGRSEKSIKAKIHQLKINHEI